MKPAEVKQYLFRIDYQNIDDEKKPLIVGKLDISWRYAFGESGHLQTHPLEQPKEIYDLNNRDIELSFSNIPSKVLVDEVLSFDCFINNRTERDLDVSMRLASDRNYGYIWNCSLTHEVGKIPARSSFTVKLNIIPTQTGLLVS
jgi:hypothetical protein